MTLICARDLWLRVFDHRISLYHHSTPQHHQMEDGSQAHAGEPPQPGTPPTEDNAENEQQSASNTPRAAQREPVTELADQLGEQSISNHSQEPEAEPESEGELGSFEWDDLQSRFETQMQAQTDEEHKIQDDLMKLMNVRSCLRVRFFKPTLKLPSSTRSGSKFLSIKSKRDVPNGRALTALVNLNES